MKLSSAIKLFIIIVITGFSAGYIQQPNSAKEILDRSVKAHGGNALFDWKTMTIKGKVVMPDGQLKFNAEYVLYAQKPDKLRIERDLTKDNGRLFYTYFYNNGIGWRQNNLIPSTSPAMSKTHKRWLDQCDGIAFYTNNANSLKQKPDEILDGKTVFVITSVVGADTTDLFIQKDNYYFVQEKYSNITRKFSDFKKFGSVLFPTKVSEITASRTRSDETPFTFESIRYNVAIDSFLFEEDMPKKK